MSKAWMGIAPSVWLIAVILTGLDAVKPLTIDDGAFFQYARQIAQHPFDPYGFELFWYNEPTPAIEILAPSGLPYWWALGQTLLGPTPWLWKCWLFPFALLLCWAVRELLARFAPGGETPLLATIVLAPTIVLGFNLMLGVPALALALGGAAIFMRACDEDRLGLALFAGLVAGLALQTKYTAVAPVAAFYVYGLLQQRFRLVLAGGLVTAGLFVGWEAWLISRYGESHFLFALLEAPVHDAWRMSGLSQVIGWVALFGALAWPAALLGLVSLGANRVHLAFAIGFASLPFGLIAVQPAPATPIPLMRIALGGLDPALDAFFVSGLAVWGILAVAIVASLRRTSGRPSLDTAFVLGWLALELLACFVNSPFHAARRMIGPALVATLAMAQLASPLGERARLLRGVAVFGVVLGLIFGAADIADSRARLQAQDGIAAELERLGHDPRDERVWFTGHWGFQFYAEERGYWPLVSGRSRVVAGDLVLIPLGVSTQPVPQIALSAPLAMVTTASPLPLSTIPGAYQGPVPIRRQPEIQLRVAIHRVLESGLAPALPRRGGAAD